MISLSSYNLNKMHCLSSIIIQLISVRISSVRFWFLCGKVIANLCSLLFMKQISSHTYVYCTKRHSSFVIFILCGIENEFLGAFWMNKRIICSYKVFFLQNYSPNLNIFCLLLSGNRKKNTFRIVKFKLILLVVVDMHHRVI